MIINYAGDCGPLRGACFDPASAQLIAGMVGGGAKVYQGSVARRGAYNEASATEQAANVEAAGLRMRAAEERAAGTAAAREKRVETDRVIGRQVALAADSGGGMGGTILDIIGDTAARGERLALTSEAQGEARARGLEDKATFGMWRSGTQARSLRQKGDAAFTGSILEGGSKMAESTWRYGDRAGWFDDAGKSAPDSDSTDPRTGWRTRVYKAR